MIRKIAGLFLISLVLLVGCENVSNDGRLEDVGIEERNNQQMEIKEETLTVYQNNLVEEYWDDLQSMETASRYQIEVQIADNMQDVSGYLHVLYTNNENVDLNEVYFRMFPNVSANNMIVSNIKVNGEEVPLVLEYQDTAVRVDIPESLRSGESVEITMDFAQTVPVEMGGNYGLYIYMDDILALDQFIPVIPVYDDEGWNVEDPPINADMIFTDAAFFQVTVTAPEDVVLAGSGVEVSSEIADSFQEVTYVGGPQRDFFLAASPRFISSTRQVGETKVTSYFVEEYHDSGEMVLETAVHALNSFNDHFGLYPYTELDLISTPMTAGGMEYSGATSLSINFYDPNFSDIGLTYLEGAAAHEVGHQWFFNQVMSDQLDEPWLDEALVQYATYLYYVDRYGKVGAQGFVESWNQRWRSVGMEAIPIGRPAREYTRLEYSPVIYGRGPFFFMELEEQIGEQDFARLLKDYTEEFRWGISDTESFRAYAEKTCDCDLTTLFEDWVYE